MDILLISNEDTCRSRIAQELLHAFGRGMNIFTAGIMEGNGVPDAVCNVMEQNGYSISRKKPSGVGMYTHRSWDYVVTLCKEAEEELNFITLTAKRYVHFNFENHSQNRSGNEEQIATLYEVMYRQLYEFYRDELSEQLLPRCTCGANTYCRCE